MGIHRTAVVHDGAEVAKDVEIGPYCVVGPSTVIGPGCVLHPHVVVEGDTVLGENCQVFPFAVLGTQPQDKKITPGYLGKLRIGSHNQIREHVTIHGGTHLGRGVTEIGDHNMLLVGSHIGHDAIVGSRVVFTNGAMVAGHCEIQDNVILGAMVGIHQFARVGTFAMIGAGAMLSHDAPPFALVQGDRARLVGVNQIGLTRGGFRADEINVIKRVFRLLFWRDGVLQKRMAEARASASANPHATRIVDFVAASRRGICGTRGRTKGDEPAALIGRPA